MQRVFIIWLCLFLSACALPTKEDLGEESTWYEKRWSGIVRQELDSSCGPTALLTIMVYHFGDTRFTEADLIREYVENNSSEKVANALRSGLSIMELQNVAESHGYITRRVMLTKKELKHLVEFTPVLVFLRVGTYRHFAVVRGVYKKYIWLADPSRGNVKYSWKRFFKEWRMPEELRGQWDRPGGVILVRQGHEEEFAGKLLRKPVFFSTGCEGEEYCSWKELYKWLFK